MKSFSLCICFLFACFSLAKPSFSEKCISNQEQKWIKEGSAVVVDLRKKQEFKLLRVPGSINLERYAVKSKTYLKSKNIVLIGDSANKLVEELREAGFQSVVSLDNGLTEWLALGGELEGNPGELELQKEKVRKRFPKRKEKTYLCGD